MVWAIRSFSLISLWVYLFWILSSFNLIAIISLVFMCFTSDFYFTSNFMISEVFVSIPLFLGDILTTNSLNRFVLSACFDL